VQLVWLYQMLTTKACKCIRQQRHANALDNKHMKMHHTTKTCKCREGLIQELRGSMYSLLDAFKGDYTQQATHYEQRMLHLQNTFQAQLASSSPVQAVSDKQPGTNYHSTM